MRQARLQSTRPLAGLLACAAVALCACGSTQPRTPTRNAAAFARAEVAREKVRAEASDLNEWTPCRGWLAVTVAARESYLRREWPHLSSEQAREAARAQSLGCAAAPGTAGSPMSTLQDAVYISLLHFTGIYEELVHEGLKQNAEAFTVGLFGGLKLEAPPPTPPRPKPLRRRLSQR